MQILGMKKEISKLAMLLCCLLIACNTRNTLSPAEYVRYMDDVRHQLVRTVTEGADEYTIQLATPEYVATKELSQNNSSREQSAIKKRLNELQGYVFFIIHIGKKHGAEPTSATKLFSEAAQADQMTMYYMQAAEKDIMLETDSKSLMPVTYNFENNYGLAPYNSIVVGFEPGAGFGNHEMKLVFQDRFKAHSYIQASFESGQLQHLPQLSL